MRFDILHIRNGIRGIQKETGRQRSHTGSRHAVSSHGVTVEIEATRACDEVSTVNSAVCVIPTRALGSINTQNIKSDLHYLQVYLRAVETHRPGTLQFIITMIPRLVCSISLESDS